MKIKVVSDLHLEFADIDIKNNGADVLVLSGDICIANRLGKTDPLHILEPNRFYEFFARCSAAFPHVVYVMGNHEHYHGDFAESGDRIRDVLSDFDNIYFLDKDIKVIDDVTFIGGTLWTDMNKEDPLTLYHIKNMMNDFRCVANGDKPVSFKSFEPLDKPVGMTDEEWVATPIENKSKVVFKQRRGSFSPEDAVEDHKKMLGYIKQIVEGKFDEKFVVCGHHSPSKQSTKPRYENETLMNGGYSSDLSDYIIDHPQIKLWTHGHTHHMFDYMIGSTRIVCNPRGYDGYEDDTGFDMDMLVEV